ncbi:uncharacterized protein PG998_014378 [Apiospora kogelbergensis]|uniref:uncharacterized protein n=1 Tax=Apiospora kogelbergensis TaxID=1337665 RepID=UPI003131AD71
MNINPVDNPELFTDESRAGLIYAVVPVMAIASIAVGLRFYTRARVLGIIGFDDWLCLTSLVVLLALGSSGLVCKGVIGNSAKPRSDHTSELLTTQPNIAEVLTYRVLP